MIDVIYGMIYLVPLDVINVIYVIYGVWFLNKIFQQRNICIITR